MKFDQVERIVVDINYASSGQPFSLDLALTKYAADSCAWTCRSNAVLLRHGAQ